MCWDSWLEESATVNTSSLIATDGSIELLQSTTAALPLRLCVSAHRSSRLYQSSQCKLKHWPPRMKLLPVWREWIYYRRQGRSQGNREWKQDVGEAPMQTRGCIIIPNARGLLRDLFSLSNSLMFLHLCAKLNFMCCFPIWTLLCFALQDVFWFLISSASYYSSNIPMQESEVSCMFCDDYLPVELLVFLTLPFTQDSVSIGFFLFSFSPPKRQN